MAQEAAGRLPYAIDQAEIRFVEAADVRQGDQTLREVIVFAVQRSVLQESLTVVEQAKLKPVAVDVEPAALVRCYASQYRRDDDRQARALIVHIGYSRTAALVAQADELLFVKYINQIEDALSQVTGRKVFDDSIYYFPEIPTLVEPMTVAWIVGGALLIAVAASVLPAQRASRMHPVKALRYE